MECPLVAAPDSKEGVFHVEHTPVEQSPPTSRSFLDESMDAGIDHLDREDLCNLGDTGNALACEICASALLAVLHAGDQQTSRCFDTTDDAREIDLRGQQLLALVRAKRAAVSQEVDCLEQARFAGTVLADYARRPRIELETSGPDAAEILDIDRGQHIGGGSAQSRIGITTYFACGVEAALTRQLLFASVSPSST